jgi:hypothetical protein
MKKDSTVKRRIIIDDEEGAKAWGGKHLKNLTVEGQSESGIDQHKDQNEKTDEIDTAPVAYQRNCITL